MLHEKNLGNVEVANTMLIHHEFMVLGEVSDFNAVRGNALTLTTQ